MNWIIFELKGREGICLLSIDPIIKVMWAYDCFTFIKGVACMALLPLSRIYRVFASTWTQGQWPQWLCTAVHFLNVVKPVDYVMDINHCDPWP